MIIESQISEIIQILWEDLNREGLKDTPKRVAKSFDKIFGWYKIKSKDFITTFDWEKYDEMIVCKEIEFYSTCEHHMLPFFWTVTIWYIPSNKIIWLSKMPRIVEMFSRRLQNQERLTTQIADELMWILNPKWVWVIVNAKHLCMMARGVEKQSSNVTTSCLRWLFRSDWDTRGEFLKFLN